MSGSPAGILQRLLECEKRVPDPGNAGTIEVDRDLGVCALTTSGAETRTLPAPSDIGIRLSLCLEADGGDCTLTVTGGYDETGSTTITFGDTGDSVHLVSVAQGTRTYVWRVIGYDGVSGPTTILGTINAAGSIKSTNATGGVGYGTGAGGAVTQITSAATGVTLNKITGQITTVALTTAAAAEERFTVTNSAVAATDVIVLGTTYDGAGTPMLSVQKVAAGAFDVVVTNVHAANALNALMVINFAVIKGVAA